MGCMQKTTPCGRAEPERFFRSPGKGLRRRSFPHHETIGHAIKDHVADRPFVRAIDQLMSIFTALEKVRIFVS